MRSTPHINPTAPIGADDPPARRPLRAKFIAGPTWRTRQFNAVRNMQATPAYRAVSVMGSGMGIPSISCAHELIHEFGCTRLVRVGTVPCSQMSAPQHDGRPGRLLELGVPGPVPDPRLHAPIGSFRLIDVVRPLANRRARSTWATSPPTPSTARTQPSTGPGSSWACSRSRWSPARPGRTRRRPREVSEPWVSSPSRTPEYGRVRTPGASEPPLPP